MNNEEQILRSQIRKAIKIVKEKRESKERAKGEQRD